MKEEGGLTTRIELIKRPERNPQVVSLQRQQEPT